MLSPLLPRRVRWPALPGLVTPELVTGPGHGRLASRCRFSHAARQAGSALLALVGLALASGAGATTLRVLVSSGPQVHLRVSVGGALQPWQVGVQGANLTLEGRDAGSPTLYLAPSPGSVVEIAGKAYRGGVLLRREGPGVQAINVVDLEDYLRGVVAAEMPASWPAAALAAQAVIARTYAASRIDPKKSYDTCATERCQVYGGVQAEHPATDAAIRATAGQVVAFAGQPAQTFFSSDSGGYVASSHEVWNTPLPYLIAQADPHSVSAGGPRASWELSVPLSRVQGVAADYGVRVGALRDVRVSRASDSGRVQELTFSGASGVERLAGAEAGGFMRALGAQSSRITLRVEEGALQVQGAGMGHGVGLSQYGALGMARAGHTHPQMLAFYYPGTNLSALAALRPEPGSPAQASGEAPWETRGAPLVAARMFLPSFPTRQVSE
ncbi:stage II sporulation protein D [Deinococcus reticulitermitis]|uniref:Stage II sporulation protein D n=1 Tax=Deinococcus reticulitermitis TaxID=856736 RepID=A0A1H6WUY7_9DEIO|nr:SpoIID/LytB domain-containing protein [Deinococcus reticulitermitis]SEJ16580.1 stage II sporulation protein D [Deinococcus reticulitermitis]